MKSIRKYPRTHHIEGSRTQPGDESLDSVPLDAIGEGMLVIEEKLDGANAGISFNDSGELLLQSRGHYLTGGAREKHFALFKTWASAHARSLYERLGSRYVLYGEWLYAKHTIFYDALPHYFMEFDVLDLESDAFLSTKERHQLLSDTPIRSVPVLHTGSIRGVDDLRKLIRRSLYKRADWKAKLANRLKELGLDEARAWSQTDESDLAEGLYLKLEREGCVVERYKFVRESFLTTVTSSDSHWLSRPIVPNELAEGVELFGEES